MSQIMHFQLSKKQNSVPNPLNGQSIGEDMLQATNGRSTIQVSSLIQNADGTNKTIKIRNFQALFDQAYSNQASNNDTTLNEAMMTNENSSSQTHHSYSDSKESLEQQMRKLQQMQPNGQPFSQGVLNYQMSLVGSKMAMYNGSASSEYYNQQMSILDLQQALRIQDVQNASATNCLLENLVQPPVFKVERIDKDDISQSDPAHLPQHGDGSEPDASYHNKYENDSESLCNDEDQKLLEED